MFEKQIVIDGKGHIKGRLAAVVAKHLLSGQRIVVVRAEKLVLSGLLYNHRTDHHEWLNKKSNINPRKGGPYHFKAPARMFWRAVRGMLPHKTKRGAAALERLKVFEGTPYPYSNLKKKVVPKALKVVRLNRGRKSCLLGELSSVVGWNHGKTVERLEEKRLQRAEKYHQKKSLLDKAINQDVSKLDTVKALRQQLEQFGY
jgi:large subunit ribosomal protein L13Ae